MLSQLIVPSRSVYLSIYTSISVPWGRFILEYLVPTRDS
jgi:hypothetical protein